MLFAAFAAVLALFMMPRSLLAEDPSSPRPPGDIAGVVLAGHGRHVAHADVVLLNHDGRPVARTFSGPNGHFVFRYLRPGRYTVKAAKYQVGGGQVRTVVMPKMISKVRIKLN
jgi:hypothetical protein